MVERADTSANKPTGATEKTPSKEAGGGPAGMTASQSAGPGQGGRPGQSSSPGHSSSPGQSGSPGHSGSTGQSGSPGQSGSTGQGSVSGPGASSNQNSNTASKPASGTVAAAGALAGSAKQPDTGGGSGTTQYGAGSRGDGQGSAVNADAVNHVVDTVRQASSHLAEEVRHAAESLVEEQRGRAVEAVHGVADALRRTAETLHDEDQEFVAHYADRAAEQVDRISQVMRERTLGDLLGDAESFARRQPEVFLAGAVAAGFILGRFILAGGGPQGRHASGADQGYRGGDRARGDRTRSDVSSAQRAVRNEAGGREAI